MRALPGGGPGGRSPAWAFARWSIWNVAGSVWPRRTNASRHSRHGQARVGSSGIRVAERRQDVVQHRGLPLAGGGAPADLGPELRHGPVEVVSSVHRVGDPGQDVGGFARVGEGPLQPRVVPRTENGGDRPVEREPHAGRRREMDPGRSLAARIPDRLQARSQPPKVSALGVGPAAGEEGARRV